EVLEERFQLRLRAGDAGVLGPAVGVLEVEVGAEVGLGAVADEGGLGLAALVVDVGVVETAVLANVQVRPAVGAGVAPADLDADLHVEDLFVAAGVTVVCHRAPLLVAHGGRREADANTRGAAGRTARPSERPHADAPGGDVDFP